LTKKKLPFKEVVKSLDLDLVMQPDLPSELWTLIASFLSPYELSKLSQTNRYFNLLCRSDSLWKTFSYRIGFTSIANTGFQTFYEAYTRQICARGFMLGYWHRCFEEEKDNPRGGVVKVELINQFMAVKSLVVHTHQVNLDEEVIQPHPLFHLSQFDIDFRTILQIAPGGKIVNDGHRILLPPKPVVKRLNDNKFELDLETCHRYRKFIPSQPPFRHPFEGTWIAQYGPHGIEILSISLVNPAEGLTPKFPNFDQPSPPFDGRRLVATKLTGDPNIPAGKTTFCVDLSNHLGQTPPNRFGPGTWKAHPAFLQIAQNGYRSPVFTPAVFWYRADDAEKDAFYLFWNQIMLATKYHRITLED